jgi:DNA-binding response OmpR family regulator
VIRARILVVDDSANIRTMVAGYLESEGFEVATAADGRQALEEARALRPELVVLDIMMPAMGGYEFLRVFRQESDAPVVMLTAKIDEEDKVVGLELGADDYITKPFGMRELAARVRAVLRRAERQPRPPAVLVAGDLELDRGRHSVSVAGRAVELTRSELQLLAALMAQPGRVLSRLELLAEVQGNEHAASERTIDVHVRNLRTKIEPEPSRPRYIETVYGAGYRLASERGGT